MFEGEIREEYPAKKAGQSIQKEAMKNEEVKE
jgi:hypothetical protein